MGKKINWDKEIRFLVKEAKRLIREGDPNDPSIKLLKKQVKAVICERNI